MSCESILSDSDETPKLLARGSVTPTFQDYTAELGEAVESLELGQLVIDSARFTLSDAIGSIELMDKKMDSGMIDGNTTTIDTSIGRLPEEVIGIMDQILAAEMSWHYGRSLQQTLFAIPYIVEPLLSYEGNLEEAVFPQNLNAYQSSVQSGLVHVVLRAYALATVKCCHHVLEEITQGPLYQEEDICMYCQLNPLEKTENSEILHLLSDAGLWISENSSEILSKSSQDMIMALTSRLKLRTAFISTLIYSNLDTCRKYVNVCLELLASVKSTICLGICPEGVMSMIFQRNLDTTVPPRQIVISTPQEGLERLEKLLRQQKAVFKMEEYTSSTNLLNRLHVFATQKPSVQPYVRAFLQTLLNYQNMIFGRYYHQDVARESILELCAPRSELFDPSNLVAEAPTSKEFKIARIMQGFLERTSPIIYDYMRVLCYNRPRQRRNLGKILGDWEILHAEASARDEELRRYLTDEPSVDDEGKDNFVGPLSFWVYFHKLEILNLIIMLGWELDIYLLYEWSAAYHYLLHIVSVQLEHVQQIQDNISYQVTPGKSTTEGRTANRSLGLVNYYIRYYKIIICMARAYFQLFVLLCRLNALPVPRNDNSSHQARYNVRFSLFRNVEAPSYVPYEQFLESQGQLTQDNSALLRDTCSALMFAIPLLTELGEMSIENKHFVGCEAFHEEKIKQLSFSCVRMTERIGQLAQGLSLRKIIKKAKINNIIKENHPWFPIIDIPIEDD